MLETYEEVDDKDLGDRILRDRLDFARTKLKNKKLPSINDNPAELMEIIQDISSIRLQEICTGLHSRKNFEIGKTHGKQFSHENLLL